MLAAFLLVIPAVALAQANFVQRVTSEVASAKTRYTQATTALASVRSQQRALEQRISDLKQADQRGPTLDRLLKRSVNAEAALEMHRQALRQAENAFATQLSAAIRDIDLEIRRNVPALKQGPCRTASGPRKKSTGSEASGTSCAPTLLGWPRRESGRAPGHSTECSSALRMARPN
ncbi:MAG: hypothetical protein AAF449_22220 [Myxococcota bacterium]